MPSGIKISELQPIDKITMSDMIEISHKEIVDDVATYQSNSVCVSQLAEAIEGTTRLGYYYFTSSREIGIGLDNTVICKLSFSLLQDTDADNWTEFKIDTKFNEKSDRIKAYVSYRHNGVEMARHPVETWGIDGEHTLNLGYHLANLSCDIGHSWEVLLRLEGGTGVIKIGDATTVMTVIGFSEEQRWDGTIGYEIPIPSYMQNVSLKDIIATLSLKQTANYRDGDSSRRPRYNVAIPNYKEENLSKNIIDTDSSGNTSCIVKVIELDYVIRCMDAYDFYDMKADADLDQQSLEDGLF